VAEKNDSGAAERSGACARCGAPVHEPGRSHCLACRLMPSPRGAAVAVLLMLGLGVLLGSGSSQIAQSAGVQSIVLEASPPAEPAPEPVEAASAEAAPAPEPAPVPATASVPPAPLPASEEAPPQAPLEPELPPELPEAETLPPVKHVFLIALGEIGYEEAFGESSPAPYLSRDLPAKGELLANYYAVTKGVLANQIALLSGQGPTLETAAGCPSYTDVVPATVSPQGQVEGSGCIYPAATETLPGQLQAKELKWKAYVEDRAAPCVREEGSRDPFVYFHALTDDPACASDDVDLEQLATDLAVAKRTPALS
jgi:hypothetical protein